MNCSATGFDARFFNVKVNAGHDFETRIDAVICEAGRSRAENFDVTVDGSRNCVLSVPDRWYRIKSRS